MDDVDGVGIVMECQEGDVNLKINHSDNDVERNGDRDGDGALEMGMSNTSMSLCVNRSHFPDEFFIEELKRRKYERAAHRVEMDSCSCFDSLYFFSLLQSHDVDDLVRCENYFSAFMKSCCANAVNANFKLRVFIFLNLLKSPGHQTKPDQFLHGPITKIVRFYGRLVGIDCSDVLSGVAELQNREISASFMETARADVINVFHQFFQSKSFIQGMVPKAAALSSPQRPPMFKWKFLSDQVITCVTFHACLPHILFCGSSDGFLSVWKVSLFQAPVSLGTIDSGLREPVHQLRFEEQSPWIGIVSNRHISLCSLVIDGECVSTPSVIHCGAHNAQVFDLKFCRPCGSDSKRYVVSCSEDKKVCRWGFITQSDFIVSKSECRFKEDVIPMSLFECDKSGDLDKHESQMCCSTSCGNIYSLSLSDEVLNYRFVGSLFPSPSRLLVSEIYETDDDEFVTSYAYPGQQWKVRDSIPSFVPSLTCSLQLLWFRISISSRSFQAHTLRQFTLSKQSAAPKISSSMSTLTITQGDSISCLDLLESAHTIKRHSRLDFCSLGAPWHVLMGLGGSIFVVSLPEESERGVSIFEV